MICRFDLLRFAACFDNLFLSVVRLCPLGARAPLHACRQIEKIRGEQNSIAPVSEAKRMHGTIKMSASADVTIPVIDISALLPTDASSGNKTCREKVSPEEREVAQQLDDAARNFGFFYLTGCCRPTTLAGRRSESSKNADGSMIDVEEILNHGRLIFSLDSDSKKKMRAQSGEGPGWEPPGAQNLDEGRLGDLLGMEKGVDAAASGGGGDLKESYIVSNMTGKGGVLQARWPPSTEATSNGFQDSIEAYHGNCRNISAAVMRGFAIALGCRPTVFEDDIADPFTKLRMLKYPAKNAAHYTPEHSPGCGSHTDWGLLTLLVQDDVGGLEVCVPSSSICNESPGSTCSKGEPIWIHVPQRDGAILANVGDMLLRWTNGRYRSAPHRVLQPLKDNADRYSIAFFINGNADAMIDAGRLLPDEVPKWSPITSMDYILERVAATYSDV